MKKQTIKFTILIALCQIVCSCKKFVDVGQPKNQLVTSEVFADSSDASASLAGTYYAMITNPLGINSGGQTLYPGLSADELVLTKSNTAVGQFYADNILITNNLNYGLWSGAYNYIYSANATIDGVTKSTTIPTSAKTSLLAEARFIRGYEYFCLLNLYSGVPLATGIDYRVNSILPRATTDQVYSQVISDLQYAEVNLGAGTGDNGRPNSMAASAVLAKVFLYQGKYTQASAEATKVISSGNYQLENDLNQVFLSGSAETIWQLDLPFNKYTWEGQTFVPTSTHAVPKYALNNDLYDSFEEGDLRLADWTKTNTVGAKSYVYPYKYKNNALATAATESYILLRLADLYLIRAEAEMNLGDFEDAVNDIDTIRNRAGLGNTSASDTPSIFEAIQNERRHEFFCEGGNRWFDLKRWNLTTSVLSVIKPGWNSNDQLYPIPSSQISANPNLTQNPGY